MTLGSNVPIAVRPMSADAATGRARSSRQKTAPSTDITLFDYVMSPQERTQSMSKSKVYKTYSIWTAVAINAPSIGWNRMTHHETWDDAMHHIEKVDKSYRTAIEELRRKLNGGYLTE